MSVLKEQADTIRPELSEASKIAERAEAMGRDMTADEKAIYDPIVAKARQVADSMKKVRDDDATMTAIKSEFAGVIGELGGSSTEAKSRRLSFKGLGTKVATQMLGQVARRRWRPLAPPSSARSSARSGRVGPTGTRAAGRRPGVQHTTPEFAYLRQTVRTNAAAVVPEGRQADQRLHGQQGPQHAGSGRAVEQASLALAAGRARPGGHQVLLQRTILDASAASDE